MIIRSIREGKRVRQTIKHKLNKYLLALTYLKGGPIIACLTITDDYYWC